MNEQNALATRDSGTSIQQITQSAYDKVADPVAFCKWMGGLIRQSGTFGTADGPGGVAQGELIAMQCLVEKLPPLEFARTYHMIEGKQVMRADAMLAKFQMSGGKVKWNKLTNAEVSATFISGDNSLEFTATYDEFVKNGVAVGKSGVKDNWKKFPKAMLRARVISDGVRTLKPEIIFGYYTPEEVEDFAPQSVRQEPAPTASTGKQWTPAQSVIDKLDAKFAASADAVNAYLVQKGILKEGGSYRDLRGQQANTVLESADEIVANATAPVVEVVEGGAK